MKKAFLLLLLIATGTQAQRYEILSGDMKKLEGITDYNITFDYKGMTVHGYATEEEYLADKMKKREKHEGKAEKFKEDWFANRENLYEPAFINYFNGVFKKGEVKVGKNPEAKYTMEVKTTWVYPGYDAGTDTEQAKISAIVTVRETANPTNVLVSIAFDKSIGLSHQIGNSLGDRISWAYERIAKNFTIQLKRYL
ncbi:hypothetical protein [Flavobacterium sp.]|uniref:hypothetical protein n=1 Tax=Flavobacterium sp. TaxID=239 RepID=UPI0039E58D7D